MPDSDSTNQSDANNERSARVDDEQITILNKDEEEGTIPEPEEKIIWTPNFILVFALVLILGVSTESLLTVGWVSNLFFVNSWAMLGHVTLIAFGWLILAIISRSPWIRLGCIFGELWAAFLFLTVLLNAHGMGLSAPAQTPLNAATCLALLGTYLGFSIADTLRTRWDHLLLFLLPLLSAIGVVATLVLTHRTSNLVVENAIAVAALSVCCLLWWLRPSCWQAEPGPTFLFGLAPAILLLTAFFNASTNSLFLTQITSFTVPGTLENSNLFFFAQVTLLTLFLACLRTTKSELNN